jgi:hypothetical protein
LVDRAPSRLCPTAQIGSALSLSPCDSAAPSAVFINVDRNHCYIDSFASTPSNNAFLNPALARIVDVTTPQDGHIHIWSPNLWTNDGGLQQQAMSVANNGWNLDASIAPPAWDSASQGFDQGLSDLGTGFGQRFTPTLSELDFPPTIIDGQSHLTLQTPEFGVYNNFVDMPNDFANFNSSPWDDLTAMDTQPTMTSFNQLSLPTLSSMHAAPALPTNATSMFTAPAAPRPIARRVVSRHYNVNTNTHTCDYPGCGHIFGRMGDFVRHRKQHGVPQHPCLVHGCNRRGSRAFYRADKLRDHQRKKHRMAV